MPGPYFSQGAVQNAVRPRPTDEQLAFNQGRKVGPVSPENLDAIRAYIDSLGPEQEWTKERADYLASQISKNSAGWLRRDNTPAWSAGMATPVARATEAGVEGTHQIMKRLLPQAPKAIKGLAYNAAGRTGLRAAQLGLGVAARGVSLPVAAGVEVGLSGISEAGNVMSRPSIEQVQGNLPDALFHESRDPTDLTKFKDWTHVLGKMVHSLNPLEGLMREDQIAEAIMANPNAQVDFNSLEKYALYPGLPKGFGPNDPTYGYQIDKDGNPVLGEDGNPMVDPTAKRLGQIRAERAGHIYNAKTEEELRAYAVYNAMMNQRFLAAKKARDEKARQELYSGGAHMFF